MLKCLRNVVDLDLDLDLPEKSNDLKWSKLPCLGGGHASTFCCAAQAEHTVWTGLTRGSGGPPTSSLGTRAKRARSNNACRTV